MPWWGGAAPGAGVVRAELTLSESQRRFAVERLVTRLRCAAVVFYAVASAVRPGDDTALTWVIGAVLAIGAVLGVAVDRRDRPSGPRTSAMFMALDTGIVAAVLANNTDDPLDVIPIIAFVIVYEGAMRWGRNGGVAMGVVMAAIVAGWTAVTLERAGLPISSESLLLRAGTTVLVGYGFGTLVQQLQRQRGAMQHALDASNDALMTVDPQGCVTSANDACRAVLGIGPEEPIGQHLASMFVDGPAGSLRADGRALTLELVPHHAPGRMVEVRLSPVPQIDASFAVCRDITARAQRAEQLSHAATHDSLTTLSNRRSLMQRLAELLGEGSGAGLVWVLMIDLDDFKRVNDSLGHQAGDQLLIALAERIERAATPPALAVRLGGDEFAIVLTGIEEPSGVDALAQRLSAELSRPVELGSDRARVTACIGIACGVPGVATLDELLHQADIAVYAAKAQGKHGVVRYRKGMEDRFLGGRALSSDLRAALRTGAGLSVAYQPIVRVDGPDGRPADADATIVGVEALCRWLHPTRGELQPDEFVSAAERLGMIDLLGRFVRRRAMSEVGHLVAGEPGLVLSINTSASELGGASFVEHLADDADETGFPLQRLILEITETVTISDSEQTLETVAHLRELGVRLAIDDFGTGRASLAVLRWLPVEFLKLEQAFVHEAAGGDADARAIAETVTTLASRLGLRVVAEGVETEAHRTEVRRLGCELAQGHLFGAPVDVRLLGLLAARRAAPRTGTLAESGSSPATMET